MSLPQQVAKGIRRSKDQQKKTAVSGRLSGAKRAKEEDAIGKRIVIGGVLSKN